MLGRLQRKLAQARHQKRFDASLEHLHGSPVAKDGVSVIALVRDGMYHLDAFLEHYRSIGAAQFIFCDNGSTDGTVERLSREPDCIVLRSILPWGEVENTFRHAAAERFCQGKWCLYADMDEIFVCESLPDLAAALDAGGYTAQVAQMLEMVPQAPLAETASLSYPDALEAFAWYDLRGISRHDYHDAGLGFAWFLQQNEAPEGLQVMFGGVRKRVFGEECCLTKHPMVKLVDGAWPGVHPHAAAHVRVAPWTSLIKHYKFAGDTAARDADTLARGVSVHGEDRARLERMQAEEALTLWSPEAQRYDGLEPLYETGFLVPRG